MYHIGSVMAGIVVLLTGFQNCGGAEMASAREYQAGKPVQDLQHIKTLLEGMNAEDLSCVADSDCAAIPIGSQACGGPTEYIVASRLNPRHDEVLNLADLHRRKSLEENRNVAAVSSCALLLPPDVACVSAVCNKR